MSIGIGAENPSWDDSAGANRLALSSREGAKATNRAPLLELKFNRRPTHRRGERLAAPSASRIVAIYPGSFDPITNGHLDLIERGSKLADRLIVAVLHNRRKQSLFTVDERVEMLTEVVKPYSNVEVGWFHGLLVDYVSTRG